MTKLFTIAQRIDTINGPVYAQAGPDIALSSNAKLTTAKRKWMEDNGVKAAVNFSIHAEDADVSKVFVILRKVMLDGRRVLLHVNDHPTAYATKSDAKRVRKLMGGKDAGYIIFSYAVDGEPTPTVQEYTFTITVSGTSEEEARNRITVA